MSKLAALARSLAFPAVVGVIICVSAGTWELQFVWAVLGVMAALYVALIAFGDPGLVRERAAPAGDNRDRLTRPLGALFLLTHWVVAGLDVGRFHWSPVPWEVQVVGVIGYAAALSVNFWALRVNRFYSSAVRVQEDRGHHVISGGPYRFVRHPGYAATLFAMFSGGAALGSWLAVLPIIGFAVLFVRRLLLEDRMLHAELPGYAEYAQRVRSRLIPGVF